MISVSRWIDLDGVEAQKLENYSAIKRIVKIGIEEGIIAPDKEGYLWVVKGEKNPVHAELSKEVVGLRYSAKASN